MDRVDHFGHRAEKSKENQISQNNEVLKQIVLAVEFLAKQGLPFRGHRDDKVDFSLESKNKGNLVATLQLLAKGTNTNLAFSTPKQISFNNLFLFVSIL